MKRNTLLILIVDDFSDGCDAVRSTEHIPRITFTFLASYLSISTFSPRVHLAIVFGVVIKESGLAVTKPDHAAVVWVVLTIVAEEFPTKHVSAEREREVRRCLQNHTNFKF